MADLVSLTLHNPKWRLRVFKVICKVLPVAFRLRLFPAQWLEPTCDALIAWVVRGIRVK